MSNIYLILCFVGKCFTTWGWRKIWIIYIFTWLFLDGALVSGALVYLSYQWTFWHFFNIFYFWWNIGWFEARYIFFHTGNIFILMEFLLLGDNISCVKLLVDAVREDSEELLFDDPRRDDYVERTSITGEKYSCLYMQKTGRCPVLFPLGFLVYLGFWFTYTKFLVLFLQYLVMLLLCSPVLLLCSPLYFMLVLPYMFSNSLD